MLSSPFMAAAPGGDAEAAQHLELLLSMCYDKQHSNAAVQLTVSCMDKLSSQSADLTAAISIIAAIVRDIGELMH